MTREALAIARDAIILLVSDSHGRHFGYRYYRKGAR